MARIRSIKPSFFKSEELAMLSAWHRLCYEGLWCWADREGRLEDRPRRLKAEIFPYDDLDMETLLAGLATAGFILRYEVDGRRYISIPKFLDHQIPKRDERESVIPQPPTGIDAEQQLNSSGPAIVQPLGRYEGRKVGEREEVAPVGRRAEDMQELWNETTKPPIPRCRELSAKRKKHVTARIRERPIEEWAEIFARIQASSFCQGENDRGWVASFDWVMEQPDVAVKVLEGKYDNRAQVKPWSPVPDAETTRKNDPYANMQWGKPA